MLRILIIAGGFLAITAGLLVFQPGMGQAPRQASSLADEPAAPVSQVQVSRLLRRTLKKIQDKIDPDGVMIRS